MDPHGRAHDCWSCSPLPGALCALCPGLWLAAVICGCALKPCTIPRSARCFSEDLTTRSWRMVLAVPTGLMLLLRTMNWRGRGVWGHGRGSRGAQSNAFCQLAAFCGSPAERWPCSFPRTAGSVPGLPASSQELPPSPGSPAPPQADPQAGIQNLEDAGPMYRFGEVAEGTRSGDGPDAHPSMCRPDAGREAEATSKWKAPRLEWEETREAYSMVIKSQALVATTMCRRRAGARAGGPGQPPARMTLRIGAPCVSELRTWAGLPARPVNGWGPAQQSFGARAVDPEGVGGNPSLTDR